MIKRYNKDLSVSYELTRDETQELNETGYCYDEDLEMGVMKVGYEYVLVKATDEYDSIKFYKEY